MTQYYIMQNDRSGDERISYTLFHVEGKHNVSRMVIPLPPEAAKKWAYDIHHGAEWITPADAVKMGLIRPTTPTSTPKGFPSDERQPMRLAITVRNGVMEFYGCENLPDNLELYSVDYDLMDTDKTPHNVNGECLVNKLDTADNNPQFAKRIAQTWSDVRSGTWNA